MLQIAFERIRKSNHRFSKRNIDATSVVQEVIQLDENVVLRRWELDNILAESNKLSKDIGELMKVEKIKAAILKKKQF
jgi:seryl-tRNA synthetase